MDSLEGTKMRAVINSMDKEYETEEDEDIKDEEFEKQIKKLRRGKAVGEDGIENEVWIHATMEIMDVYKQLVRKI